MASTTSSPSDSSPSRSGRVKLAVGLALVTAVAVVAIGYFGVHTLFIDDTVTEAGPVFDSGAAATEPEVMSADASDAAADPATTPTTAPATEPVIRTLAAGTFGPSKDRYDVSGSAEVLNDGSEQRFIRFEDFSSTNGPDLNVYLRADDGTFVDLGDLKGNIGDQNYEIPADVDLSVYRTVEIWCVRFDVGFGFADLA